MSLFKVCSCWSVQCSDILENYDSSSLICYRFGLNDNEKDYIIVGSHSGNLSIYYPRCEIDSDGNFQNYQPTDLLLEIKLKLPIISLSAGKFTGTLKNEKTNQLAILHPFSLVIYSISILDGVAEHGKQSSLQILAEHKFNTAAYSICKGAFGHVKSREFICITHMDGTLTFYEQDGINYECYLPGPKALPSVLAYISRTDSFVRVNLCWELECFSYQDLSQSSGTKTDITPNWSICVGEFIMDIRPVQVTNTRTSIMLLGEHNLLCVSDDGRFQFIIKLDYSPKCFTSFVVGWYWEANARLITAILSESSSLLIYDEMKLIWAAQLEETPIAIQRSNLHNLPGGIVTLSANGLLNISYLGSEPFIFKVPPLNLQEMNFEKAHNELLDLEKDIKEGIDLTDIEMINTLAKENFELDFYLLPKLEKCNFHNISENIKILLKNDIDILMCTGELKYKAKINIEQIQINFYTTEGIKCSQSMMTFNDIKANSSDLIEISFYLCDKIYICTNEIKVVVSYITNQSIPRVLVKKHFLPLNLLYKKCPAQKDAAIKLTLSINSKIAKNCKISSIFSEICGDDTADNDIQALGLLLVHMEAVVTIVAAKNSNRFRIQSDFLEAIPAVLEAMINYLKNLDSTITKNSIDINIQKMDNKGRRKGNKRQLQSKSKLLLMAPPVILPSNQIMLRLDSHHGIQENIRKQTALMDLLWNQFKLFQRSLQSKGENDPIDGLMMLIEKNYDDLVTEGDKLMELRNGEKCERSNLSCAIGLMNQLISCLNIENRTIELIQSVLIYPIEDWTEKSWEETIDSSLNMLHHYGPLCRNKNSNNFLKDQHFLVSANQNSSVSDYFDFDRFKRHMTSLFDRVTRLASLDPQQRYALPKEKNQNSKNIIKTNTTTNDDVNNENFESMNESDIVNEIPDDDSNIKNSKRLETLPDDEDDEIDHDDEDGDDDELDKTRENDWTNTEIPATELMMLKNKSKKLI